MLLISTSIRRFFISSLPTSRDLWRFARLLPFVAEHQPGGIDRINHLHPPEGNDASENSEALELGVIVTEVER
jgi:hypothetical protein